MKTANLLLLLTFSVPLLAGGVEERVKKSRNLSNSPVNKILTIPSRGLGSADGGGGDSRDWSIGAAWFLGKRAIHYCYVGDLGLGDNFDEQGVEKILAEAFSTWKQYLSKKKIYQSEIAKDQKMQLIFNHEFMEDGCDGTEDIKFFFSDPSDEASLKLLKRDKKRYNRPLAFAQRTNPGKNGWGKGYIWIAGHHQIRKGVYPDWQKPNLLKGIILHELGHVLGCEHTPGTIMRAEIARDIEMASMAPADWASSALYQLKMTKIDNQRELATNTHIKRSIPGMMIAPFYRNQDDLRAERSATFKRFFGRDPVGRSVEACLTMGPKSAELKLKDEKGSKTLSLPLEATKSLFQGSEVFRVDRVPYDPWYLLSHGTIMDAEVKDLAKEGHLAQIVNNSLNTGVGMNQIKGNVQVFYYVGSTRYQLFEGQPHLEFKKNNPCKD